MSQAHTPNTEVITFLTTLLEASALPTFLESHARHLLAWFLPLPPPHLPRVTFKPASLTNAVSAIAFALPPRITSIIITSFTFRPSDFPAGVLPSIPSFNIIPTTSRKRSRLNEPTGPFSRPQTYEKVLALWEQKRDQHSLFQLNRQLRIECDKFPLTEIKVDTFKFYHARHHLPFTIELYMSRGLSVLNAEGLLDVEIEGGNAKSSSKSKPFIRLSSFEPLGANLVHDFIRDQDLDRGEIQIQRVQPIQYSTPLPRHPFSKSVDHPLPSLYPLPRPSSQSLPLSSDAAVYTLPRVITTYVRAKKNLLVLKNFIKDLRRNQKLHLLADIMEDELTPKTEGPSPRLSVNALVLAFEEYMDVSLAALGKQRDDLNDEAWLRSLGEDVWGDLECGGHDFGRSYVSIGKDVSATLDLLSRTAFVQPPDHLRRMVKDFMSGITSLWLYIVGWKSIFTLHLEDWGLSSFNYHVAGVGTKVWWIFLPADKDKIRKFISETTHHRPSAANFTTQNSDFVSPLLPVPPPTEQQRNTNFCPEAAKHREVVVSPYAIARALGIRFNLVFQRENHLLIIHRDAFHCGINFGVTVNVAANCSHHTHAFEFPGRCKCGFLPEPNPRWEHKSEPAYELVDRWCEV